MWSLRQDATPGSALRDASSARSAVDDGLSAILRGCCSDLRWLVFHGGRRMLCSERLRSAGAGSSSINWTSKQIRLCACKESPVALQWGPLRVRQCWHRRWYRCAADRLVLAQARFGHVHGHGNLCRALCHALRRSRRRRGLRLRLCATCGLRGPLNQRRLRRGRRFLTAAGATGACRCGCWRCALQRDRSVCWRNQAKALVQRVQGGRPVEP